MARRRPSESTANSRSLSEAVRGRITEDPTQLTPFERDASHLSGRPLAAVAPADADDLVELVRWARQTRTPLVARGGGTSLDGESVPPDGSIVVDLSGWSQLLEVDPEGEWARVAPGIVNRELARALRPYGRFFPPNPGSWTASTIGGNVSTNASGMRSFQYGSTRDWVHEVEAVLGTGERVRLGSRVAKRSVGPDLLQMFVGSEGTLGIATEVTVRLAPLPAERQGVVVPLPDDVRLAPIAQRLARFPGIGLSAIEYLDRPSAEVLAERHAGKLPPASALLLLEVEADDADDAGRKLERLSEALGPVGGGDDATVFRDADELWTLRGESGDALLERIGYHVREDVAVPVGEVDRLIAGLRSIAGSEEVPLFLYGHLGEGSLHPNYAVDPTTPKAERIRASVLRAARSLGGTISAEHGIGVLKRPFLVEELGEAAVRLLLAVKRACDPDGILNPGKLYPTSPRPARARGPPRSPSGPAGDGTRPE